MADLAAYRVRKREPLCFGHSAGTRDLRICGMPPPSAGTIAIAQIFGMLPHTPASGLAPIDGAPGAQWLHLYTEAARLAFADRAQFVADPDFVAAPAGAWPSLLEPAYLAQRASLIGPRRMPAATAGRPGGVSTSYAPMRFQEEHGTSHLSIVDREGNAVAMTSTIEASWGSRQMVNRGRGLSGGFLLNNELSDFSFEPTDSAGRPVANRVQPGKRPRSAMAPTMVFDRTNGQLLAILGSPGGAMIINYTAKALYAQLQWGMNAQQAIALPNFGVLGEGPLLLEAHRFPRSTVEALQASGHEVRETPLTSGVQAITRRGRGYFSGADPRREGIVLGD
jgi:gamma-glutamyltranspeptidase/glutathione hydrolase